jgi:flagellar biosynthetic protein FliO
MEILQQLLAVGLVLGALGALVWALKRRGWVQSRIPSRDVQTQLEVIGRLTLTPQHSVHLIRMADRVLLVGLSPGGCNVLETAPAANISGVNPPGANR